MEFKKSQKNETFLNSPQFLEFEEFIFNAYPEYLKELSLFKKSIEDKNKTEEKKNNILDDLENDLKEIQNNIKPIEIKKEVVKNIDEKKTKKKEIINDIIKSVKEKEIKKNNKSIYSCIIDDTDDEKKEKPTKNKEEKKFNTLFIDGYFLDQPIIDYLNNLDYNIENIIIKYHSQNKEQYKKINNLPFTLKYIYISRCGDVKDQKYIIDNEIFKIPFGCNIIFCESGRPKYAGDFTNRVIINKKDYNNIESIKGVRQRPTKLIYTEIFKPVINSVGQKKYIIFSDVETPEESDWAMWR